MSQQQSYDSQENSPDSQPAFNPDPREPASWQEQQNEAYQAVYAEGARQFGEKVYPTPRRRRGRFRWLWITLLVILILALISGGFSGVNQAFSKSEALATRTFAVQSEPKLVVKDPVGTVHIHAGGSRNIVVDGIKHSGFFGNPGDVQVNLKQNGNELDVIIENNSGPTFFNASNVDLNITVPSLSDIQDNSNAGTLSIDGVSGQMNVQANAGTIDVTNATLKGDSTFEANAGTINYSGSLTPHGTYNFHTDAGSINLTLPSNSSFTLDSKVNAGSVNNDFESDTVGSAPYAQVIANANAGSVNIHKA
jgi:hypothetical protein